MQIISEGSEYCFLNFLENLRSNSTGWLAATFPFSKKLNHDRLISGKSFIRAELHALQKESTLFAGEFSRLVGDGYGGRLYQFADNDLIFLCRPSGNGEYERICIMLDLMVSRFPTGFCRYGALVSDFYHFQKIADHKILTRKKMEAYRLLGEENILASVPLRRRRRDDPVIMIVEDDRFTASYISTFLRDFDVVLAKNGEDAIVKYIEYAPDAVFLDIHMAGLDGLQTLSAIKSADPSAFVVMLSVDASRATIMKACEKGATSYLKKPFSRERILNTLRLSPFIQNSYGLMPVERARTHV